MMAPANDRIACFFATSGHSGVDRIVRNLLPGLVDAGYKVDLLKIRDHGPVLTKVRDGLRIVELRSRHVYTALPPLVRYLRQVRPGVLISDKDRVNRTAILARLLAGVKLRQLVRIGTTVSHNLLHRGILENWVQCNSMRYLYRLADGVLMPSQGAANDFSAHIRVPTQRIRVVPSPVITPDLLRLADEPVDHPWFAEGQPPVILGVGELSARKDFTTLLHAYARLAKHTDCRLMILGRGKQRDKLERLADELGITERFSLPGFVANPYPYMKSARLFVLSSKWEGLGIVLVEALALGTPVVSTDCPSGPAEILGNGIYGGLAPVGDDQALAKVMEQYLQRPLPSGQTARAVEPYTLRRSVDAYLDAMGLERLR